MNFPPRWRSNSEATVVAQLAVSGVASDFRSLNNPPSKVIEDGWSLAQYENVNLLPELHTDATNESLAFADKDNDDDHDDVDEPSFCSKHNQVDRWSAILFPMASSILGAVYAITNAVSRGVGSGCINGAESGPREAPLLAPTTVASPIPRCKNSSSSWTGNVRSSISVTILAASLGQTSRSLHTSGCCRTYIRGVLRRYSRNALAFDSC